MDMAMDILATDMVVMDTMDIMARGPQMLSLDMVMDMDMVTMDIMARDQLSQDMDIMAMDMDMVMVMVVVMDTMVKQICCSFLEFSTSEVGLYRSSQNTHNFHLTEINIEKK